MQVHKICTHKKNTKCYSARKTTTDTIKYRWSYNKHIHTHTSTHNLTHKLLFLCNVGMALIKTATDLLIFLKAFNSTVIKYKNCIVRKLE